eukprot:14165999-Ditylum_brightwellii.AAC.1
MEIKSTEITVAGFFIFSHVKYHSRKNAKAKIGKRVSLENFNLHIHTVQYTQHMQQCHTKALAISLGRDVVRDGQAKLYWMNKQSAAKNEKFLYTKKLGFCPLPSRRLHQGGTYSKHD